MKIAPEIIELADQILRSYYFEAGPTRVNRNSDRVMVGVRSAPMQLDFPIFVDQPSMITAALMLRKIKKRDFGSVPLKKAERFILDLVNIEISHFFDLKIPASASGNYRSTINNKKLDEFYNFIQKGILSGPDTQTFSFPLSRISVSSPFSGSSFYIIGGDDIGGESPHSTLEKFKFKQSINGWIGCSATFVESAQKIKRIVLGAISLRLPHLERTQKTIARPANGYMTHNPLAWSSSREHMPPIGYDITIAEDDKSWLEKIDELLLANDKESRRLRKALEYFYFGWFLEANERLAFNFMAMDAVFGQGSGHTGEKLRTRVSRTLEQDMDLDRFDDIINLRNQFLHGGSPDIYDSSKYEFYLQKYSCDPIIDVEYLTASCLRRLVFGVDFGMQKNPYHIEIQKLKDRGLIPSQPSQITIIQES